MTDQDNITNPACKMWLRTDQVRETFVADGEVYCFRSIGRRADGCDAAGFRSRIK